MRIKLSIAALTMALPGMASAGIATLNLADYQISGVFDIDYVQTEEASAVTYNWDTGTLFVLGDEGDALAEISTSGALLGSMTLTGFDDTEGLTYIGGGQFVITEERLQDGYLLSYGAGGSIARGSLASVSFGDTIGNTGIEGLTYDPNSGDYLLVKEKTPQAVYASTIDFGAGAATVAALFDPASLGLLDLSDIQAMSTVASLSAAEQDNLLIVSQESSLIVEIDRSGNVLSSFDLGALTDSAEGLTLGPDGTIYVVSEDFIGGGTPRLYVLKPVPEAEIYALMLAGLGLVGAMARRK
jgi:uncharacterized protein YjiK